LRSVLPIDIAVIRRDALGIELNYRIMPGEPYFTDLRERWSAALRAAHIAIPRPPYATRPVETIPIRPPRRAVQQCRRGAPPVPLED
jgi:predicted proteasome-type protease